MASIVSKYLDRDNELELAAIAAVAVAVSQMAEPGTIFDIAVLVPALAAFVFQGRLTRRSPELAVVLVAAPIAYVVAWRGALEPVLFLSVTLGLYLAAYGVGLARLFLLFLGVMGLYIGTAMASTRDAEIAWETWAMAHGFTVAMGHLLHRQSELIDELTETRAVLAEQAVADERRRIARELHDLSGHTLAAMLLHVTGARHLLRRDPDEAERALTDAERVGRDSLEQIRATVTTLRTDERGTDRSLPAGRDLRPLVEEYRKAGLSIDATVDKEVEEVAGPTGVALHRIAREALANVARHAPGNRVHLTARTSADADPGIRLTVVDRGAAPPRADDTRPHFGLAGMAERARALGGHLDAGPTDDGWRVEARLPLEARVR